jgi:hypothetical protein
MFRTRIVLGVVTVLTSLAIAVSCTSTVDDCANTSTCPSSAGSASGGEAGGGKTHGGDRSFGGDSHGGESGDTSGGTTNVAGDGSTSGGEAGAGGGGPVALPCDGACAAPKPVCDEPTDTCVECLEQADCAAGSKRKCDVDAKACVACLASSDCSTAAAAKCDGGECVKCTSNDDCAHIAGKAVCDTGTGECVQCTGKDYASCGMDLGAPLVCDSLKRTCTTSKEHGADLCRPCVSDAQCPAGQLCMNQTFGAPAAPVGYFCFWKKGDNAAGAPASCLTAKPYSSTLANQTSIDGTKSDICSLASSTCVARSHLADAKDCATADAADDDKCGFAPGVDSKCTDKGGGFRCTMACASSEDCPGNLACDGTSFCKL